MSIPGFFSSFQPSWIVSAALLLGVGGSVVVNESRFQTHVVDREAVMDKSMTDLRLDVTTLEAAIQTSQIEMARLQEQVSHLWEDIKGMDSKLDLLLNRRTAR